MHCSQNMGAFGCSYVHICSCDIMQGYKRKDKSNMAPFKVCMYKKLKMYPGSDILFGGGVRGQGVNVGGGRGVSDSNKHKVASVLQV